MPPRPEPLAPYEMVELTTNPAPRSHGKTLRLFTEATYERAPSSEPRRREAQETEVVVWSPPVESVPAPRGEPAPRVSMECIALADKLDPRLTLLNAPDSAQAKAFRLLRHRLLRQSDPRLIGVTSADRGEGKTTCAVNLALAIAEETLTRVLLFEANVRQPSAARLFGFEPRECLSRQLGRLQGSMRGYSIAAVAGTRLCIAAMAPDLPPGTRLDRFILGVALSELRSEFDYVVVDTSSALESADANAVAESVDGVIIVARAERSRQRRIKRAINQLGTAPLLGIALLDSREAA
jgi:Mrp family chromosome partitioning ATPase